MSKVVIVSKTRMNGAYCVGALEVKTNKFLRLKTAQGYNQPEDTIFDIGDVFEVEYTPLSSPKAPHVEDVLVTSEEHLGVKSNLSTYLQNTGVKIVKGAANKLFERKLGVTGSGRAYIDEDDIPNASVGFWMPDKNLVLNTDGKSYQIEGEWTGITTITYVGTQKARAKILAGTLVRVSLARWWSNTLDMPERCYLQLSGWYL